MIVHLEYSIIEEHEISSISQNLIFCGFLIFTGTGAHNNTSQMFLMFRIPLFVYIFYVL